MAPIVVGGKDCTLNEVLVVILRCASVTDIRKKWREIATFLGISIQHQDDINDNNPDAAPVVLLQRILTSWTGTAADKATLDNLIDTLVETGFRDIANALETKIRTPKTTGVHGGGDKSGLPASSGSNLSLQRAAEVKKKKKHIIDNMETLIATTYFNSSLSARMVAHGILGREDVEILDSMKVRTQQNTQFYMFVHDKLDGRPEFFEKVADALEELTQTGASFALKQVYKFDWS